MPVAAEIYYSLYQGSEKNTLPVVLLHGAAGNQLSWGVEIRRLKGFSVYAVDLPGHGKSSTLDGQQTIGGYADKMIEWLDATGILRAVFVGHSMGGAISLELGIHHPERVLGLGLVSTGLRLRVNTELLELASQPETFNTAIALLAAKSFGPSASKRLVELAVQRMSETRPSVLHGDLLACNGFDARENVKVIKRPVLVVVGTEDQMTPVRYSQFIADAIPGTQLQILQGAGHMSILEQPLEVAMAIVNFLKTIVYNPGEET